MPRCSLSAGSRHNRVKASKGGGNVTEDGQLLRQYARQGSEAAFSQLIARHLNLVHSVCLREVGDASLAEDVTQVVFLLLAKKAPALGPDTRLAGWLFQTARFACKNALRREARRKLQEQRVGEQMLFGGHDENALWDRIEPGLNDALASLGAKDREAVLLRFADGLSFPELGTALGTSEDAARMRLNRAVDRLRQFFAKQGVTLSGAVLVGLLADRTAQAAPAACAAAVTKIAGSAAAVSPSVHLKLQGVLKAMTISKLKLAAIIGVGGILAASLPFMTLAQSHKGTAFPVSQKRVVFKKKTAQAPVDQRRVPALEQAAQATASLRSLAADVEEGGILPPAKWTPIAKLALKRPAKARSESPGTYGQTSVVNGGSFWFYMNRDKTYQQEAGVNLKEDRIGPEVFSTFFFNPKLQGLICFGVKPSAETQARPLGMKRWHGETVTAVQIAYTTVQHNQDDPFPLILTAYLGGDHLLHGFTVDATYRGKRTVDEYALKNLRINPAISDSEFAFTPPAGAKPSRPPTAHLH